MYDHIGKNQDRARLLTDDELGEVRQSIHEAKDALRNYKELHRAVDQVEIPPVPQA
jgi:hypothetical protein